MSLLSLNTSSPFSYPLFNDEVQLDLPSMAYDRDLKVRPEAFLRTIPSSEWSAPEIASTFDVCMWDGRLQAYLLDLHFNTFSRGRSDSMPEWCEPDYVIMRGCKARANEPRARFIEVKSEDYLRGCVAVGRRYQFDRRKGNWRCPSAETIAREDFGFSYEVVPDFDSISPAGEHES